MAKKQMFGFVHIEKCGGTTLIHVLRRNFPFGHVDVILSDAHSMAIDSKDFEKTVRLNPFAMHFAGHSIRGNSDFGRYNDRMKLYTLLRDPVKRYISDYMHDLRRGYTGSLKDWGKFEDRINLQTKALAGEANAEKAIDILKNRIHMFGVLEQFDRFMVDVEHMFAPRRFPLDYVKVNTAADPKGELWKSDQKRPEFSEEDLAYVRELNSEDVKLYEAALELLKEKEQREALSYKSFHPKVAKIRVLINRVIRNLYYKTMMGHHPLRPHTLPRYAVDSETYYNSLEEK